MRVSKPARVALVAALILPLAAVLLPQAPARVQGPEGLFLASEKAKQLKTEQGYPDLFMQYHHQIRSSASGVNDYTTGYRVKELNTALAAAKTATRLGWIERGPGNVGGRTRPLLVDPDDPLQHTWWAGSVGGGLWKTINGGLNWQYQTDHLPNLSVTALAMAESDHDVLYMGTGEGFGNIDRVGGSGMFRSRDRGQSWEHLMVTTVGTDFAYVNRLAVHPTNADVVLAATNEGLFRTTDGGDSWTAVYRGSGRIQDLRAQPGNFDVLVATENGRGILRSSDAGRSWVHADVLWQDGPGRIEVAYSPSDPAVAYAAANTAAQGGQLYRSEDGGATWLPTFEPTNTNWLGSQGWYDNTLAVHPFDPDIVFLGGIQLWRTVLSGETRDVSGPSSLDRGGTDQWLVLRDIGGGAHFGILHYFGDEGGDVTPADYGTVEIRFGQGTQRAHRYWVPEDAGSDGDGTSGVPDSLYIWGGYVEVPFQVWDTDNNKQLAVSFRDQADDGEWTLTHRNFSGGRDGHSREYTFINKYEYDPNAAQPEMARNGGHAVGRLYYFWPILRDGASFDPENLPAQTITITFARGTAVVRSIDRRIDASGLAHVDHHNIVPVPVDPASETFWVLNANDGGVAVSKNGGELFREVDRAFAGYNTAQFYGVSKRPGVSMYLAGTQDNGTWRSFPNANSQRGWQRQLGGDGFETVWHSKDDKKMLGSIQFNLIYRSLNGGTSWASALPGETGDNGQFITTLASSDAAPDEVYTSGRSGVWRSTDFAGSWTLTPISSHWGFWHGGKVRVSLADSTVVWAGHGMDDGRRMHISRNRGESFRATELPVMTPTPSARLSGLATHPTEAGTAYALFSRRSRPKVLETKNYGETWSDLSGFAGSSSGESSNGFPNVAVHDLVVMPHSTNVIWVGTDIGLFKSKSYGAEWNYAHNGLPAVSIWRMKVRDDEVVVATHGRGIWTVPTGDVDVAIEEDPADVPTGFGLHPNYPNPFNASTILRFTVPEAVDVCVTIFDAQGRKVRVLTDRRYEAGTHALTWDAGAEASGVYFARLESDGKLVRIRQMTLVK